MADLINPVTVVSLATTAAFAVFSIICGFKLKRTLPQIEKWVLSWLVFDALTHLTLEVVFLFLSLTGTVEKSQHFTADLWKEYGKADKRWLVSDPTIVSLEILTVVVDGLLCLVLIYAIIRNKSYRHFVQIILCVCELYGGWMTFCPEWLTGSKNLVTDNVLYLWVYLIFFNGIWVVIPLGLLYQSYVDMTTAGEAVRGSQKKNKGKLNKSYVDMTTAGEAVRGSQKKNNGGRVQDISADVNVEFVKKYNTRRRKEK